MELQVHHEIDTTHGLLVDKVWLDVEQCEGCWESDLEKNGDYLKAAADEGKRLGFKVLYDLIRRWASTVVRASGRRPSAATLA